MGQQLGQQILNVLPQSDAMVAFQRYALRKMYSIRLIAKKQPIATQIQNAYTLILDLASVPSTS